MPKMLSLRHRFFVSLFALAACAQPGWAQTPAAPPQHAETLAQADGYMLTNTVTLERTPQGYQSRREGFEQRPVSISLSKDQGILLLQLDATIRLWRVPDGLRRILWPVEKGVTFSREDAMVMAGAASLDAVPTWGANIDWPGLGPVTLVLFRMGDDQFGGLLSSEPSGVNILRQMVFQKSRPGMRPRLQEPEKHPCPQC